MDIIRTAQMRGAIPNNNLIVLLWELIQYSSLQFLYPLTPWLPYLVIAGVIASILLIIILILKILFFFFQLKAESVFLEVIPTDVTLQTHFSTEQLFTTIHSIVESSSWIDSMIGNLKPMSFELVSTKEEGIRYVIKTSPSNADLITKNLRAYLPGISVSVISDYLPRDFTSMKNKIVHIVELNLRKHFCIPITTQSHLTEHDPIAYITSHMTKLNKDERIVFQIVAIPLYSNTHPKKREEIDAIGNGIFKGNDITPRLKRPSNVLMWLLKSTFFFIPELLMFSLLTPFQIMFYLSSSDKTVEMLPLWIFKGPKVKKFSELSPDHQNLQKEISGLIEEMC